MSTTERTESIHETVRERYGEIARQGTMAGAGSCCGPSAAEVSSKLGYKDEELAAVPEGANLGVGCGAPLAHAALRAGETVVDLGSGAGFDAFLAAREVGDGGHVIGVDMTPDMLDRARRNATSGGYTNVEFREGLIEKLPVESGTVDVVISNCVINLAPHKGAVFAEIARVLKPGARMVVSDVVLDKALPPMILESVQAWTGCVAGAELRQDYLAAIAAAGLGDIEVLEEKDFGEIILSMAPGALLEQAREAGIDAVAMARTVKSVKVRARKPG